MEILDFIVYELLFGQVLIYCIKSFLLLARKKKERSGTVATIKTTFVTTLIILSSILFLSSFGFSHIQLIFNVPMNASFLFSMQLGLSFLIFAIALLNTENMHLEKFTEA
jgi:hypothetical protein